MIEINLKSRTHKIQVRHLTKNVKLQHIGQRGPTGPDGTAATIQVGTVTTVPNTDPATITNVGTTSAAVFDFEIPEGEQGNQGIPGVVQSIVAGTNVTVDDTDPANPVVSASGGGGGGAVDSVNGQTGVVVLDTDDIADTATNRFTDDTAIARLANTSGTNTGDQTLSGLGGVPTSRTINGQDLSANRTFTQDDIGDGTTYKQYSATEKTKLAGIEALADVTDATNVAAAGAFMKSVDDTDDITVGTTNKFATAAEKTKLGHVTVTQAVDLDTMESDIAGKQPLDSDLTSIAGLTPSNDDVIQRKAGAWTNRTMAQVKTDLSLAKGDVGLGNVDNTSDATKNSATATLTNKRITKRVTSLTSSATPTINTDNCDKVDITALATAITSMTTNLTGTPTNGDMLIFEIKDDATPRAITWGSSFVAGGVALPTTTVASKILTVGFMYSTANSLNKWRCIASAQEA